MDEACSRFWSPINSPNSRKRSRYPTRRAARPSPCGTRFDRSWPSARRTTRSDTYGNSPSRHVRTDSENPTPWPICHRLPGTRICERRIRDLLLLRPDRTRGARRSRRRSGTTGAPARVFPHHPRVGPSGFVGWRRTSIGAIGIGRRGRSERSDSSGTKFGKSDDGSASGSGGWSRRENTGERRARYVRYGGYSAR
jgi:hypothetical protein